MRSARLIGPSLGIRPIVLLLNRCRPQLVTKDVRPVVTESSLPALLSVPRGTLRAWEHSHRHPESQEFHRKRFRRPPEFRTLPCALRRECNRLAIRLRRRSVKLYPLESQLSPRIIQAPLDVLFFELQQALPAVLVDMR